MCDCSRNTPTLLNRNTARSSTGTVLVTVLSAEQIAGDKIDSHKNMLLTNTTAEKVSEHGEDDNRHSEKKKLDIQW